MKDKHSEIKAVIKANCGRHYVKWWGQKCLSVSVPVEEIFGDGKLIIGFAPLATRPNYYVIAVDSSWGLDNDASPCIADHCDEILDAIEEEYGDTEMDDEDDPSPFVGKGFPVLNTSAGEQWWEIKRLEMNLQKGKTK